MPRVFFFFFSLLIYLAGFSKDACMSPCFLDTLLYVVRASTLWLFSRFILDILIGDCSSGTEDDLSSLWGLMLGRIMFEGVLLAEGEKSLYFFTSGILN